MPHIPNIHKLFENWIFYNVVISIISNIKNANFHSNANDSQSVKGNILYADCKGNNNSHQINVASVKRSSNNNSIVILKQFHCSDSIASWFLQRFLPRWHMKLPLYTTKFTTIYLWKSRATHIWNIYLTNREHCVNLMSSGMCALFANFRLTISVILCCSNKPYIS